MDGSFIPLQDGKDLLQIPRYCQTHYQKIFLSRLESISWLTLALHCQTLLIIGYVLSLQFLTPYRGVQYHLKEWAQIPNARPTTYKELYNLRHSSLRNVIERGFRVIKRRFPVLRFGSEYSLNTQIKLFPALALLSNYIDRFEEWKDIEDDGGDDDDGPLQQNGEARAIDEAEHRALEFRDKITQQMWKDYQEYLTPN